jgi:ferredoxin
MKSIVIYYSQTENTKKIAQALQRGITQQTGQCDIARLKEVKPEAWLNYDLIGIGCPVKGGEPVSMYLDYVKSLPPTVKDKHTFFYFTHGILPSRSLIIGVKALQEKGLTVIGWKDWYCGCIPLPGHAKPWFTDGHPDAIDIAEAESFGAAMAEHSRKISHGATDIIPTLLSPETSDWLYGNVFQDMKEKPPFGALPPQAKVELSVNAEKCTGCGLCAEACFYNNIDISVTPPVFKSYDCCGRDLNTFCEDICPTGAIENKGSPLLKFKAGEIMGGMRRSLDIAEAKGLFRRLVREEDMDWDTPWEKPTEHPHFKEIP